MAVIAAASLGDVVKQHRDVERAARRRSAGTRRWRADDRSLSEPALDPRQQADRPDRMLVDRIMMVHVELHLRDDAAEIGNEAAEDTGLVHPAQHRLPDRAPTGQHVEKKRVGAGSARTAASISLAWRAAARIASGWISRPYLSASANIWISRIGSAREEVVVGHGEPAAVEHEAFELARAAAEGREAEAPAAPARTSRRDGRGRRRSGRRPSSRAGNSGA